MWISGQLLHLAALMVSKRNTSINEGLILYLKLSTCYPLVGSTPPSMLIFILLWNSSWLLMCLIIVYPGLHVAIDRWRWAFGEILMYFLCFRHLKRVVRGVQVTAEGGWLTQLGRLREIPSTLGVGGSDEGRDNSDKRLIKGPICALAATDALHKSHSTRLPTNKPHVNSLQRWYAKRQWEDENNGCEFKLPSLQSAQPKRISNSSSMQARGSRAVQWHHLCVILHWLAYSPTVFLS